MPVRKGNVCVYYCNWIKAPHDKIALCICDTNYWVFWFNSAAAFHKIGQLPCDAPDHPAALVKPCFLDFSSVKAMSQQEIAAAADRGPISDSFRAKILSALSAPIARLSSSHKNLAIANLT